MKPVGRILPAILLGLMSGTAGLAQGPGPPGPSGSVQTASPPPWKRYLAGENAAQVRRLAQQRFELFRAGKYREAIEPASEAAEIRTRLQGADHWQAADARRIVDDLRMVAALPEEGRRAIATLPDLMDKAAAATARAEYAEAERLNRRVLEIRRQWFGEEHSDTASSSNSLAQILQNQGKYAEAEPLLRKALAIRLKAMGEDHPETARAYGNLAANLERRGEYAQAEPLHRKALASRIKILGEAHPETATGYNNLAINRDHRGKYAQAEPLYRRALAIRLKAMGEDHLDTAQSFNNLAVNLNKQGKYRVAEPMLRRALAIRLKALGEAHPDTVMSYNNVAVNLGDQARYTEAEPIFRNVLALYLKAAGEAHPDTATAYNNLAGNLSSQGKYAEGEALYRKALAIWSKALGEVHTDTANGYHSLANCLDLQGKYAEGEALHRKALALYLRAVGEVHPDTANSYDGLANNLMYQGQYAEAEPLLRKALALRLETIGPDHPHTAISYHNLAADLERQDRFAEAEALYLKALDIDLKALGEAHPSTASSCNNVAYALDEQGRYPEAEALHRRALAIRIKLMGERHPETAHSYGNLARNLDYQGRYAEAEPLHRKALAVRLDALGTSHPHTALGYHRLAMNLDQQGKLDEAIENWTAAAAVYERARGARGATGLERSVVFDRSPLPALAIALARRGRAREAWSRWEAELARGLLDDLSARTLRPSTPEERRREADLAGQIQGLDEQIGRLVGRPGRTRDEDTELNRLRGRQSDLRIRLVEFQAAMERQYQAYAGKPSPLEDIQKAIPVDAALVGWLESKGQHWACAIRREGDPVWIRIPGTGPNGAWTIEDDRRPARLSRSLAANRPDAGRMAEGLARHRLAPLWPHLENVGRLIVLPSPAMAGVPVEALVAAQPAGAPCPVISYAPSGSMFARLASSRSRPSGPPRLLALGDPTFPGPAPEKPLPPPPDHGIPIVAVATNGIAGLFDIRPGDILLEYDRKPLKSTADLAALSTRGKSSRVAVKTWREGDIRSFTVAAGPLGVRFDGSRSAARFVREMREAMSILRARFGAPGLTPLPGTRREVEAIAMLFPEGQATTLLQADATESKLQGMARSGALKGYRFIHLATHGAADPAMALRSAIYLAAEPEQPGTPADPAAMDPVSDGQVTAEQIVRTWDLDADLVVLSACESGLGREAGGEGYLGFAQALFVKGARSLVLSQWSVEDRATALLMARFYQDLLGKRPGLSRPMPKAEALHEAKQWLRNLTADEVGRELAALDLGHVRPLAKESGGAAQSGSPAARPVGVRPYAHPYYWAAFILVGDPD